MRTLSRETVQVTAAMEAMQRCRRARDALLGAGDRYHSMLPPVGRTAPRCARRSFLDDAAVLSLHGRRRDDATFMTVSFTHVVNPFPGRPGSEHAVASRITWASLAVAVECARAIGLEVSIKAVILPGDEGAVEAPATTIAYLERTVADVAALEPVRKLPLIGDLLRVGAEAVSSSHLIFTNMDIAVQPGFYVRAAELVGTLGPDVPFMLPRLNVPAELAGATLEELYAAEGPLGHGFDCFVIPHHLLGGLDLGNACIGAGHFDLLLVMQLDRLSGYRSRHLLDERLTFHLGNEIGWVTQIDYLEHNLRESVAALQRQAPAQPVPEGSAYAVWARHFRRNARWDSALLRRVRRVPALAGFIHRVKQALGRQY